MIQLRQIVIISVGERKSKIAVIRRKDIHTIYSQIRQENSELKNQLRDITVQLNEMREQYDERYYNLPVPNITVNCKGDILKCNRLACVFFGKKSEALCMDNLMTFLDVSSRGRMNLFLHMMMEERLRSKIESSDLEVDFFVRGKRYETIIRYTVLLYKEEIRIEFAILDLSEQRKQRVSSIREHKWYQLALQTSKDYIFEYNQVKDELREYGDFCNPDFPKTEEIIKRQFLQEVTRCQKRQTYSYQLMREILLGDRTSGELNLAEIDYYNFHGWAYLEIAPNDGTIPTTNVIGRIRDITEEKIAELAKKEELCKDDITGFYHSEYGLDLMIKKLEAGKLQGRNDHLLLINMKVSEEIEQSYGALFLEGSLYLMSQCMKQMQDREGMSIIRVGKWEFLALLNDKTEIEALQITNRLLERLNRNYRGDEYNGLIQYQVVLKTTLCWEGYPDWRFVIQDMYRHGIKENERSTIIIDGRVQDEFCNDIPFIMKNYEGTTKFLVKRKKPFFIYANELLEESPKIEWSLKLLINIFAMFYQLRFLYCYDWSMDTQKEAVVMNYESSQQALEQDEIELRYLKGDMLEELREQLKMSQAKETRKSRYWIFGKMKNNIKKAIVYGTSQGENMWTQEEKAMYEQFSSLLFFALEYTKKENSYKEQIDEVKIQDKMFHHSLEKLEQNFQKLKYILEQSEVFYEEFLLQEIEKAIQKIGRQEENIVNLFDKFK